MECAVQVKNVHGRDVLISAELLAKSEFPRMMRELKTNIRSMKP